MACKESTPKAMVKSKPKLTYNMMIESENMLAFLIPSALVLLCLVKKLTFIGIIGNTQGVSNAVNPASKPNKNICQPDCGPSGMAAVDTVCPTTVAFFSTSFIVVSAMLESFFTSALSTSNFEL
jgi:hypothetical protein